VRSSSLSGGLPRRLYHHAGKWVLEVVRHVNVGQDLIRPTMQRLTGHRAITSYFKNNPDKAALGKATQRLLQTEFGGETRSFSLEGSEWIANSTPPARGGVLDSLVPGSDLPTLEMDVSELKAQVVVLTAVQEGLLMRLARLEGRIAKGWVDGGASSASNEAVRPAKAPPKPAPPPARESVRELEEESPPEPFDADAELAAPESFDDNPGSEPLSAPEPAPAAAPAEAPAQTRLLLALPSVNELAKCVVLLIGGDVSAREATEELPVNRTTRDCYAAALLDDSEQTVGVILMDLKAAVYLGGTLMMLPKSELESQLRALTPGEDSIAASAEICNALAGAINGAQDQHVRVGALGKFDFKSWSWVAQPADRRDLEDSFGGRTAVLSRPLPEQIF
jgi:hypothetical protein